MHQPTTIEELQAIVRREEFVRVRGGGTKTALSAAANVSTAGLSGVLQYNPDEFTLTALAGTPIKEIEKQLAGHGQCLPFEPPLTAAGATLGGTVAAGLSGSGRFRFGGVRDFVLGVRFVTGTGENIFGGGKVVKNAAGFDIPKLMVGSCGRLGILVEITLKVFPAPKATGTLVAEFRDFDGCYQAFSRTATRPADLMCLDMAPPRRLWLRVGGSGDALKNRLNRLEESLESAARTEVFDDDAQLWSDVREFAWVRQGHRLIKIPLAPSHIPRLEDELTNSIDPQRRYAVGGNLALLAWPDEESDSVLHDMLIRLGRPGLALTGKWDNPHLGAAATNPFLNRLLPVFDPDGKIATLQPGESRMANPGLH